MIDREGSTLNTHHSAMAPGKMFKQQANSGSKLGGEKFSRSKFGELRWLKDTKTCLDLGGRPGIMVAKC